MGGDVSVVAEAEVLYVENSEQSVRLIQEAFRELDVIELLHVVADGSEAIEFLRNRTREREVLVLLDLDLPGLHGFEVLEIVREDDDLADIPVFIFTSSNRETDKQRAAELGATAYIEKPASFRGYLDTVKELLSYD